MERHLSLVKQSKIANIINRTSTAGQSSMIFLVEKKTLLDLIFAMVINFLIHSSIINSRPFVNLLSTL